LKSGIICVPGAILGSIYGGLHVKIFNVSGRGIIIFTIVTTLLSAVFYGMAGSLACDDRKIVGVNIPYPGNLNVTGLDSSCNADCACMTNYYEPICLDGNTYFSPCYAGCTDAPTDEGDYYTCSCAPGHTAYHGQCDFSIEEKEDCDHKLVVSLGLMFACALFIFMCDTSIPLVLLRVVPPALKAHSMTNYWVIIKVIGYIPGPLICGYLIDRACILWQDKCEGEGVCWLYTNEQIIQAVLVVPLVSKVVNIILLVAAALVYKPLADNIQPVVLDTNIESKKSEETDM